MTPHGFLLRAEQWSELVAEQTARESGIAELTRRHWQAINSMRNAYADHGALPWLRMDQQSLRGPEQRTLPALPKGPGEARRQGHRNPQVRASLHLTQGR